MFAKVAPWLESGMKTRTFRRGDRVRLTKGAMKTQQWRWAGLPRPGVGRITNFVGGKTARVVVRFPKIGLFGFLPKDIERA